MKAAILYGNDDIRYTDIQTPQIEKGEILVKVKMTGICGSDVPRVLHNGAHYYPIILGHEFSGEVAAVAEDVTSFVPGDRVSGAPLVPCLYCEDCMRGNYSQCKHYTFIGSRIAGSFAQYVKLPAICAVKFSSSISYEQGAFFEPSTVALHGLFCAGFVGGRDVAVLGGGTIGIFTMQWARIMGAKSVTVFDISRTRLHLAKKMGADYVVHALEDEFCEGMYQDVFETAGVVDTMQLAFRLAANKASLCYIGTPTQNVTFTPKLWENMNRKELKITGSWMSYSPPFPGREWELTAHYFATGQLKFDEDLIFAKLPMKEVKKAFDMYKQPGYVGGKILLYN